MRIIIAFVIGALLLTLMALIGLLPENESLCGLIGIVVGSVCLAIGIEWQEKHESGL